MRVRARWGAVAAALMTAAAGPSCGSGRDGKVDGGNGAGAGHVSPGSGRPSPGVSAATPADLERAAVRRTVYVPVYPSVYTEDRAHPYQLATTLYVRNTDPTAPLWLATVRLHDAGGRRVRDLLAKPLRLEPLAAAEFFLKESDPAGGSAASLLVTWAAAGPVSAPVVEAVMIGTLSNQGIALTSPGRTLPERPQDRLGDDGEDGPGKTEP